MKKKIEFLNHVGDHLPGDIVTVDEEFASKLIRTGRAKLAPAAKAKAKPAARKTKASQPPAAATDASPVDEP